MQFTTFNEQVAEQLKSAAETTGGLAGYLGFRHTRYCGTARRGDGRTRRPEDAFREPAWGLLIGHGRPLPRSGVLSRDSTGILGRDNGFKLICFVRSLAAPV